MMDFLRMARWSPYAAGAGIGLLTWLTFLISKEALGVSAAYVRTAGMLEKAFRRGAENREYYKKHQPAVDWEWMLVAGLIIGAFLSALLSGEFRFEWVPGRWEMRFGYTPYLRTAAAFAGGAIMQFGARWTNGCTSGHGISGTLQLALSSWIAVACFFAAGVATAFLIY